MELKISDLLDCIQDESVFIIPDRRASAERVKELTMKKVNEKRGYSKRVITISLAAAIIVALGITAYAADFFGFRALLRQEKESTAGDAYNISITQPQEVPKSLDPEIAKKVANSEAAWEEWLTWRTDSRAAKGWDKPPEVFMPPDDMGGCEMEMLENGDGSYTVNIYSRSMESFDPVLAETRVATAGDYAAYQGYLSTFESYGDYDFNYGVSNSEELSKLEEIAEKYSMKLRGNQKLAWSSETAGMTGEVFFTNAELAAKTAEIGCSGNIFYETPFGFDKVYWFDEDTFCVSYYVNLPSSGEQINCYCYNSVYSTLSSGQEVYIWEKNINDFSSRTHIAPDGTELTILKSGNSAYIYVFLENSFFAERIEAENLSDSDLDYIADFLNYSLIGK